MIRYISLFLALCLFFSCGNTTKVILLPDEEGKTGKALVKTKSNQSILDEPYTSAEVSFNNDELIEKSVNKKEVEDQYQVLFAAEPKMPVSFILYFQYDSSTLTSESLTLIPKILETAKLREPSIVSIIGHTDSKGETDYNIKLALDRAKSVAKILNNSGIALKDLTIKSHGENDPLIKTNDNVSEVRNRRVEIMIR